MIFSAAAAHAQRVVNNLHSETAWPKPTGLRASMFPEGNMVVLDTKEWLQSRERRQILNDLEMWSFPVMTAMT